MDFITKLLAFMADKSHSIGKRTIMTISLTLSLLCIDLVSSLTFNIHTSYKLEQLTSIQKLKSDYWNDPVKLQQILLLESEVINKKHYSYYLNKYYNRLVGSKLLYTETSNGKGTVINLKEIKINGEQSKPAFSLGYVVVSSSYMLVIALILMLISPLLPTKMKFDSFWLAAIGFIIAIITCITLIALQIPVLWNNPVWNYILNFLIHTFFLIALLKWAKKHREKEKIKMYSE